MLEEISHLSELFPIVHLPSDLSFGLGVASLILGTLFLLLRRIGWLVLAQIVTFSVIGAIYYHLTDLGSLIWPILVLMLVFITVIGSVGWAISDER